MRSYPWPGNVRELSHVIERAVLWSRGPTLDVEHLSLTSPVDGAPPLRAQPDAAAGAAGPGGATVPPPGGDFGGWGEAIIQQAPREAGGEQAKAGARPGRSRGPHPAPPE